MRGRSFIFFILSPKQSDLFYFLWLLWQLSILSCTAVDLQDGALLWTISSSFHHKVNISFQKKSLNALFSLTRHVKTQVIIVKNELSITRPPLDGVHLCISCGGNGCRLLWSFARHQPQIISDGGNVLVFFSQSSFYVSLTKPKFQHHLLVQSRLVIHLWRSPTCNDPQSMAASLQPSLTLFSSL